MPIPTNAISNRLALRGAFENGFRRSKRGNLWRKWEELSLTVFQRADLRFGWCIASEDGPRFSRTAYEYEEDAMSALWDEVKP